MTRVTIALEEHEARALAFSSDMGEMLVARLCGRSTRFPAGESPREIAVQKIIGALERCETPDGFEALGVSSQFNRHVQRTWRP